MLYKSYIFFNIMRFIKSFDVFSAKPEFLFENTARMQTFFGGLISISVYILIVVLSIVFGLELVNKTEPNIYYNNIYVDTTDVLYYGADSLFFKLDFSFNGTRRVDDRAIRLYGFNLNNNYRQYVDFELCSNNSVFKEVENYFTPTADNVNSQLFWGNSYCIRQNPDIPVLIANTTSRGGAWILIVEVRRCTNNTRMPGQEPCYPDDVIDEILYDSGWNYDFLSYQYDPTNYTTPAVRYVQSYNTLLGITTGQTVRAMIGQTKITSDTGLIFTDLVTNNYIEVDDFLSATVDTGLLGILQLEMSNNSYVYKRNYYKMQNWLADVGGVVKALMTIASLFNYFLSDFLYYKYIGQVIFKSGIDEPESNSVEIANHTMQELKDKSSSPKHGTIKLPDNQKKPRSTKTEFQHYLRSVFCFPKRNQNYFITVKYQYQKYLNIDNYLLSLIKINKLLADESKKPIMNNYFSSNNLIEGDTKEKTKLDVKNNDTYIQNIR